MPASQGAHSAGDVDVAAAVCTVPAAHASEGTQLDWFGDDEWVSFAHAVQCRSEIGVPAVLTYMPAAQVAHGPQLEALFVVLKLPLAHALHVRSVVAVPSAPTN